MKSSLQVLAIIIIQLIANPAFAQKDISLSQIEDFIIEDQLDSLEEIGLTVLDSSAVHLKRIINKTASYGDILKLVNTIDQRPDTDYSSLIIFLDNIPPPDNEYFDQDYFGLKLYQIYSVRNDLLDMQLSKDLYDQLETYVNQFTENDSNIQKAKLFLELQPIYIKTIEHDQSGKAMATNLLQSAINLKDTTLMIEALTVINHFVYDERDLMQYIANAEQAYELESQIPEHTSIYEEVMIQLINTLSFAGGQEQRVFKLLKELHGYEPTRMASYSLFMQFIKDSGIESKYADSVLAFHQVNSLPLLAAEFIDDAKERMDKNNLHFLYRESGLALQTFGFLDQAINYIDISSTIYRQVYSEELSQALANYDKGLIEKEKEAEIAIESAKTKFFERTTYLVAISTFIVLILLFFTSRNAILLRKQRNEISQQRDLIESQKEDKEMLLQELHHRVKNNFQIIMSLMDAQAEEIDDDQYRRMNRQSAQRIKSMAIVHDCLYNQDGLNIDLSVYLRKLIAQLTFTFGESKQPEQNLDIPSIIIQMDAGILLGLIVNELVTNSFKYGFDAENPSLTLEVHSLESNKFRLFYTDNGSEIANVDLNHTGLGLSLIKRLARQLGGQLMFDSERTGFQIDFKA